VPWARRHRPEPADLPNAVGDLARLGWLDEAGSGHDGDVADPVVELAERAIMLGLRPR